MSFIRTGASVSLRAGRRVAPVNARFVSYSSSSDTGPSAEPKTSPEDAPGELPKGSSLINKESPAEAMARHQPDYNATIDHGTTYGPQSLGSIFRWLTKFIF